MLKLKFFVSLVVKQPGIAKLSIIYPLKKNSVCSEHHSLTGLLEPQNHKSSVVSVELYFNGFKKERNKHTKNPPKFLFLQEVGILKSATHNPLFNNTHTTIIN